MPSVRQTYPVRFMNAIATVVPSVAFRTYKLKVIGLLSSEKSPHQIMPELANKANALCACFSAYLIH